MSSARQMLSEIKSKIAELESLFPAPSFHEGQIVLVRDLDGYPWKLGQFVRKDEGGIYPFLVKGAPSNMYKQCLPYEGNEHLTETTQDVEGC